MAKAIQRAMGAILILTIAMSGVAWGQQNRTLDDVLSAMQSERRSVDQENQAREERFQREQATQQAELNRVRGQVSQAESEASRLENVRSELDRELANLRDELSDAQGEFGELFGVARAAAADLNAQLADSMISSQFPGRGDALSEMAQSGSLPRITELEGLWFTMLNEISEQGKVVRYQAPVVDRTNASHMEDIVRIGPFTAFGPDGYMVYNEGSLGYLARNPGGGAMAAANRVWNHTGSGVVRGLIDPAMGTLLGLVLETPTLRERIDQGGWIGYAIIVVAIFGFLLGLIRWISLSISSARVRAQMRSSQPSKSNPLGRIMLAYEAHKHEDLETLQLHLDDAVLKEIPPLERGLNLVKVLAAVTPLMGLLGTVIGMIVTFQAITLYGAGDPKMMAGGISMALVTTVQGLIAAIPLLILHAFASGTARRLGQVLEEQSVSFVADVEK